MSDSVSRMIFVNLPVADVKRSMDFFGKLGFHFNPQFTGEDSACMVLSDKAFVMLLNRSRFKDFTTREIADPRTHVEGLFALSATSRAEVDALMQAVQEGGGQEAGPPQDHGWMYYRAFLDLDGHHWELAYMDEAALQQQQQA